MKMERSGSLGQTGREIEELAKMPDDQIDVSEIAEIPDWSEAKRGAYYQPSKRQITLQLDAEVIDWFKAEAPGGRGYQIEINRVLREYMRRFR